MFYNLFPQYPQESVSRLANNAFTAFDYDKNGYLSLNEFMMCAVMIGSKNTSITLESRLEYLFYKFDYDRSKTIERNEIFWLVYGLLALNGMKIHII